MAPSKTRLLPSRARLRKLFRYDAETGKLFWMERSGKGVNGWNACHSGKEALTTINRGHRRGMLFRHSVYAHQVIWKMMMGYDPPEIDHIDGNPLNNAWKNLRLGNGGRNQKNAKKRTDNMSGQVGVVRRGERWIAQIGIGGTTEHIGIYDTIEQAIIARKERERILGFHPNHGRSP